MFLDRVGCALALPILVDVRLRRLFREPRPRRSRPGVAWKFGSSEQSEIVPVTKRSSELRHLQTVLWNRYRETYGNVVTVRTPVTFCTLPFLDPSKAWLFSFVA